MLFIYVHLVSLGGIIPQIRMKTYNNLALTGEFQPYRSITESLNIEGEYI